MLADLCAFEVSLVYKVIPGQLQSSLFAWMHAGTDGRSDSSIVGYLVVRKDSWME